MRTAVRLEPPVNVFCEGIALAGRLSRSPRGWATERPRALANPFRPGGV